MLTLKTRIQRNQRQAPSRRRRPEAGFTLIEVIIALSISAFIAMYMYAEQARQSEENIAQAAGTYIADVASATQQLILNNWSNYANNTPVTGVAVLLQPTLPELVNLGRLNAGFPTAAGSVPTRQSLQINITRTNCPGASCQVLGLVCTTTPVTLGGPRTRFDLASIMMSSQGGTGGQSLFGQGTMIRGPALNVPNPMGNVEGIVCGSGTVDTALFQKFLTLNDTRDPNFQGPVTVAGPTTVNNTLTVNGPAAVSGDTTVGTCATIRATTGRAGFGCTNPDDLPAGYTGGVRSPDVVVNGNVLASSNPAGFTGANGAYAYMGVSGGVGEVRTSGRALADRLLPTGTYAVGSACNAADEGAIARGNPNGLVTCRSSVWRDLMSFQTAGSACAPNGALADDGTGAKLLCVGGKWQPAANLLAGGTAGAICATLGQLAYDTANNNEALLCRLNPAGGSARFMRLRDITSNLMFVQSYEVTDISLGSSGQISKPVCSPASGMSATPIIQLIPKTYTSTDGGISAYAVDTGTAWQIYLRNGAGAVLTGNPNARSLANVFCFYG